MLNIGGYLLPIVILYNIHLGLEKFKKLIYYIIILVFAIQYLLIPNNYIKTVVYFYSIIEE